MKNGTHGVLIFFGPSDTFFSILFFKDLGHVRVWVEIPNTRILEWLRGHI